MLQLIHINSTHNFHLNRNGAILENVYSAPRADLSIAPEDDDTYQPKIWALSGRLGRIRYLAYLNISMIILMLPIGILAAVLLPTFATNDAVGLGDALDDRVGVDTAVEDAVLVHAQEEVRALGTDAQPTERLAAKPA